MRFWLLILLLLVLLLTVFFAAREPITEQITISSVLISDSAVDIGEDTPSKLFKMIEKDKKNDRAWQAIHYYSNITDAGYTLMFYRDCFNALKDDPLLFFDRYMAGDEKALFLMVNALSHDFSAFTGESFEQTEKVFRQSFNLIRDFITQHAKQREVDRRADNFLRISQAQYDSWRLRYCEFVRTRSNIVATNCAPGEKK
ncbi:hypothetical protein ACE1CD_35870 [Aerosakkonema sp. BLCC-F183]|uniref:hypothetical protein n=1 Tax=Aerosakkonema sp. BLCC-F183 TaxID=3342834 RepID=UPI0035B82156